MSPFTPFFTEHMYLNLRRAQPAGSAPESVHFCELPPASLVTEADTHISRVRHPSIRYPDYCGSLDYGVRSITEQGSYSNHVQLSAGLPLRSVYVAGYTGSKMF